MLRRKKEKLESDLAAVKKRVLAAMDDDDDDEDGTSTNRERERRLRR